MAPILFGFMLPGLMTTFVSGFATLRNVGLVDDFGERWFATFWSSWPIAFPTVLLVTPVVRRLVARLTVEPESQRAR